MALFVGGLYHDGWLSPAGHLTVYPAANGRVHRDAAPPAVAARGDQPTTLHLQGPDVDRRVVVAPGKSIVVIVPVSHLGA